MAVEVLEAAVSVLEHRALPRILDAVSKVGDHD
jgi:hypothetical protein